MLGDPKCGRRDKFAFRNIGMLLPQQRKDFEKVGLDFLQRFPLRVRARNSGNAAHQHAGRQIPFDQCVDDVHREYST